MSMMTSNCDRETDQERKTRETDGEKERDPMLCNASPNMVLSSHVQSIGIIPLGMIMSSFCEAGRQTPLVGCMSTPPDLNWMTLVEDSPKSYRPHLVPQYPSKRVFFHFAIRFVYSTAKCIVSTPTQQTAARYRAYGSRDSSNLAQKRNKRTIKTVSKRFRFFRFVQEWKSILYVSYCARKSVRSEYSTVQYRNIDFSK